MLECKVLTREAYEGLGRSARSGEHHPGACHTRQLCVAACSQSRQGGVDPQAGGGRPSRDGGRGPADRQNLQRARGEIQGTLHGMGLLGRARGRGRAADRPAKNEPDHRDRREEHVCRGGTLRVLFPTSSRGDETGPQLPHHRCGAEHLPTRQRYGRMGIRMDRTGNELQRTEPAWAWNGCCPMGDSCGWEPPGPTAGGSAETVPGRV